MKHRILVKAPILTQSGYGEHGRFVLRALRSQEETFDIYIFAINWGQTAWLWQDDDERRWIDEKLQKTLQYISNGGKFDMSLQVTIPNEWERITPMDIGVTAGVETTKVSKDWIDKVNSVDKVITISEFAKNTFVESIYGDTKCETKIDVVHYPVRTPEQEPLDLELTTSFNYLSIVQWGKRKNVENMLRWFIEANHDKEDVGLILKTNLARNCLLDRLTVEHMIGKIVDQDYKDRKCKIYLLHGYLTRGQMQTLYNQETVKAYITTTHGEGYGLPIFEAAYNGLPVVATDWSGHLDFLYMPSTNKKTKKTKMKPMFSRVDYELRHVPDHAVWENIIIKDSKWAYPKEKSFKIALQEIYKDHGRFLKRAKDLQNWIGENFSEDSLYRKFVNSVMNKKHLDPKEVSGVSFCISTNGQKIEKTNLTVSSIKNTMKKAGVPFEIVIAGDIDSFKNLDDVKLVDKKKEAHNGKLAMLRNFAAVECTHDVLVFADDDLIFPQSWCEKLLNFSKTNGWEILGHKILLPDKGRYWDRATTKPHVMIGYDQQTSPNQGQYQTGCFWIIRSDVYAEQKWDSSIGFYAEKDGGINEDVEYSLRLQRLGYSLSFDKENTVWHNDDSYVECYNGNIFVPGSLCLKKEELTEKYELEFFPGESKEFLEVKQAAV